MSDNFIPIQEFLDNPPQEPDMPYKLTVFRMDGTQNEFFIDRGTKLSLAGVLAVKVKIESQAQRLLNRFFDEAKSNGEHLLIDQSSGARIFAKWAEAKGLFKGGAEDKDSDWLSKELNRISTLRKVPYSYRKDVTNWYENPEKYPEVPFDIGNSILTVKPVCGGRVVVLPTGHTIAYTYARALFSILSGKDPYDYHVNQRNLDAREYTGRKRWSDVRRMKWSMTNGTLVVGCQRIPARAIEQLARREGWSGSIIAKYL